MDMPWCLWTRMVGKGPHLHASLHWLHGHELLHGGTTCEFYHGFIHHYLYVNPRARRDIQRCSMTDCTFHSR